MFSDVQNCLRLCKKEMNEMKKGKEKQRSKLNKQNLDKGWRMMF